MTFWNGVITGAGWTLFTLFIVAQAVTIELTGYVRVAVGAAGIVLTAIGLFRRRRGISPSSRPDSTAKAGE
jgi:hypothetical protein